MIWRLVCIVPLPESVFMTGPLGVFGGDYCCGGVLFVTLVPTCGFARGGIGCAYTLLILDLRLFVLDGMGCMGLT